MKNQQTQNITSVLIEKRKFSPSKQFVKDAKLNSLSAYKKMYNESIKNPEKFFSKMAEELSWFKKWNKVLSWKAPFAKWFVNGKINITYNCIDRHLNSAKRNKAAIIWEGEPGDEKILTYNDLHREVQKCANVLKKLGVKKGDRVAVYLPMIPELPITLLACARIGAVHSVIFGGFSSQALIDRINDAKAKLIVTADGGYRRGQIVNLKQSVDAAVKSTPTIERVLVVQRTNSPIEWNQDIDRWWHEELNSVPLDCKCEKLDSEHPLFILYTSGTTGKPKGVLHSTAGYLLGTYLTSKFVFDLKDEDIFWCTADIGWVTGHSYIVYGPLSNGATIFMYEGAPNFPEPNRFWKIIEKYKINIFYTAPTAIRAFIKWGTEWPLKHNLSSLRLLGTVGEPINPEAWMWYHKIIGKEKCPIVDTWWQTETGSIMITPIPGVTKTKPGTATLPFFGILPDVVNKKGESVKKNQGGYLVIKKPWPSMMRGVYGDNERFKNTYWKDFPGMYFTGDGARRDEDGYFWIMGRVDDVINVSGHRLGTMEIESALVSHKFVAEAAVVGKPDEIKGSSICAFVTLESLYKPSSELKEELRLHVANEIGAMAKPDEIRFSDTLPKTRSGKIMRRLLREIAAGSTTTGDTTTLEDFSVLEKLRQSDED